MVLFFGMSKISCIIFDHPSMTDSQDITSRSDKITKISLERGFVWMTLLKMLKYDVARIWNMLYYTDPSNLPAKKRWLKK